MKTQMCTAKVYDDTSIDPPLWEARVRVSLVAGWSGHEHLFDRVLNAIQDRLGEAAVYPSLSAVRTAVNAVVDEYGWSCGRPEVTVTRGEHIWTSGT